MCPRRHVTFTIWTKGIVIYRVTTEVQQTLLVHGFAYSRKIIVVIFVHRGVGPLLFRGRSCAGARSNTQQPASARLSQ
jgi:hypothetical protein